METSPTPPEKTQRAKLIEHLHATFAEIDAYRKEHNDERRERLAEQMQPLCLMQLIEVHVQLAWGGPCYGLKLYYDRDAKQWRKGLFYFEDWFTHDEEWLTDAEVEKVVEAYDLDGFIES